jgi:6-phosphogluconate dehydrogenase (decarboxylating)
MSRGLVKAGHHLVVFARNAKAREGLAKEGAAAAVSLADVVKKLGTKPRAVWLMLPAGQATEETVESLSGLLERDDIITDGGNSFYKDDIRRAKKTGREGHSLCRLRHLRRRLGYRPWLLHDDRRPEGRCRLPRSDLRSARSGAG